jgi:hypothetical protein
VLTKFHAVAGPSVEVVLHVHAASDTLGRAYRPGGVISAGSHVLSQCARLPVLLKGPGTIDGGLVSTSGGGDVICATVGLEATLALRAAAGVVGAVGFDNVVLYERVASPAVDRKVTVTLGVERTAVVDGADVDISGEQSCRQYG